MVSDGMIVLKKRWRRLEAWLAAHLTGRAGARGTMVAATLFALAGIAFLTGLKAAQDIFIDAAEAYAWGQQFLGGYRRPPPLTGWSRRLWARRVPRAPWGPLPPSREVCFLASQRRQILPAPRRRA